MANQPCYDRIGIGYDVTRRADPYLTRRLLGLLEPRSGGLYLDVACGSGNYTAALAAEGLAEIVLDKQRRHEKNCSGIKSYFAPVHAKD